MRTQEQIFEKVVRSICSPFQAIVSTFFFSVKKTKKSTPLGGHPNLFPPKSFCDLKPHAARANLMQKHKGEHGQSGTEFLNDAGMADG